MGTVFSTIIVILMNSWDNSKHLFLAELRSGAVRPGVWSPPLRRLDATVHAQPRHGRQI